MGEMGILRRPPRGWLEGVVLSTRHGVAPSVSDGTEGGGPEIETSYRLSVTWEVRVAGWAPYLVDDVRTCPVWVTETFGIGSGRRWYSLRLKKSWGLMTGVPIPCRVDPDDRGSIWIDWDAGYDAHVPAWDRKSAVERAVAERKGGLEGFLDKVGNRVANPLADRLDPADEHLVDEAIARQEAEAARQLEASQAAAAQFAGAGVDPEEHRAFQAMADELQRIHTTGADAPGRIVSVVDTERVLMGLAVMRLEVEVSDPSPRTAWWEMPMHPRIAKRYKPGMDVKVRVDRGDPSRISIAG